MRLWLLHLHRKCPSSRCRRRLVWQWKLDRHLWIVRTQTLSVADSSATKEESESSGSSSSTVGGSRLASMAVAPSFHLFSGVVLMVGRIFSPPLPLRYPDMAKAGSFHRTVTISFWSSSSFVIISGRAELGNGEHLLQCCITLSSFASISFWRSFLFSFISMVHSEISTKLYLDFTNSTTDKRELVQLSPSLPLPAAAPQVFPCIEVLVNVNHPPISTISSFKH